MGRDKASFPDGVRELAEQERRKLRGHPSAEDLVAYRDGRLDASETDRMADHLALCHECGDLLLDLADFEDMRHPSVEAQASGEDAEADWQALTARMQASPAAAARARATQAEGRAAATPETWRSGSGRLPARVRFALAASVLFAVVALGVGGIQWRWASQASKPRANVPLVDLFTEEDRTRGQEEVGLVPAGAEEFILVLTPPEEAVGTRNFEAVIRRGEDLLARIPLEKQRDGSLTLGLRTDQFPPGDYSLELLATTTAGQRQKIATYKFRVEGERRG